jgi:hypothetical protein
MGGDVDPCIVELFAKKEYLLPTNLPAYLLLSLQIRLGDWYESEENSGRASGKSLGRKRVTQVSRRVPVCATCAACMSFKVFEGIQGICGC